ncbi:hypothetical protein GWK47_053646 [Chionoecetes opilio]|uniref:Uncharacterized protein n=1 Tax=Chionoecetes opilio TaxID=41210 RepID=A0A8J4YAH9_CHIOP|nr:hypothetical protein GWK47_053646 [Chionoecetes opilio]
MSCLRVSLRYSVTPEKVHIGRPTIAEPVSTDPLLPVAYEREHRQELHARLRNAAARAHYARHTWTRVLQEGEAQQQVNLTQSAAAATSFCDLQPFGRESRGSGAFPKQKKLVSGRRS